MKFPFTNYILEEKLLDGAPFYLVDVGASGGIERTWSVFRDSLVAVGFDPLVNECERLNRIPCEGQVTYVPAFVGASSDVVFQDSSAQEKLPIHRTSQKLAVDMLNVDPNDRYNAFQEMVLSQYRITLDEYFEERRKRVDFLKIDTDGHDIEVLFGASDLFSEGNFLGVCIESQFHGATHGRANTFANIDIFLRERGFSLFDLQYHRYSRAALPGKFLISIPAQTDTGQVMWADAFYFRDLGDENYCRRWGVQFDTIDILKLVCLYEMHALHDCAIELILTCRSQMEKVLDVDRSLELLVPPIEGRTATLEQYHSRFRRSVEVMRILQNWNLKELPETKQKILGESSKVVLFGAGGRLRDGLSEIVSFFQNGVIFIVVDNDHTKWGTNIGSYQIVGPDKIARFRPDAVVIASLHAHEILHQLIDIKIEAGLDFTIVSY